MKKQILFFTSSMVFAVLAGAQPVLTASSNWAAGDIIIAYNCDTTNITKGATGTNVTWQFGNLISTDQDTIEVFACSATPACSAFPGSTIAVKYNPSDYHVYYKADSTGLVMIGDTSDQGHVKGFFLDPEDRYRYPLTYGSSFLDSYYAIWGLWVTQGFMSLACDAYGTLILPTGSYSNVLRLHRYDIREMSSAGVVYRDTIDSYEWVSNSMHGPLLILMTVHQNTYVIYNKQLITSVAEISVLDDVDVYPNPAKGLVQISFNSGYEGTVSFGLTDIVGVTRKFEENRFCRKGANKMILTLPPVTPGLYTLCISTNAGVITKKISLQ